MPEGGLRKFLIYFCRMEKAVIFWSGGKDSSLALYKVLQEGQYVVVGMITTLNKKYRRISMHGVREALLEKQAAAIGIPLIKMWVPDEPDNDTYERVLMSVYEELKNKGITTVIFGDIFLQDLRHYRERLLANIELHAYFPLWGYNTQHLITEFIELGFHTLTCCISTPNLSKDFLGREVDADFINALPQGVDPCGENGEFHTFCYDGPLFNTPVSFDHGEHTFSPLSVNTTEKTIEQGCWFVDLM